MNKSSIFNYRRLRPILWRWHRRTGLFAAFFVVVITVSGLFLNHSSELALAKKHVGQQWLLSTYGIELPTFTSYAIGHQWLSGDDRQQLFLNSSLLAACRGLLIGAVEFDDGFVVACEQELLLFTVNGELIEKMGPVYGLPVPLARLGLCDDQVCIATEQRVFQFDNQALAFRPVTQFNAVWSQLKKLPAQLKAELLDSYQGPGLSWERVLLDLHSGRIIGKAGVWLYDLAAILLLFLSLSGFVLWYQHYSRKKRA